MINIYIDSSEDIKIQVRDISIHFSNLDYSKKSTLNVTSKIPSKHDLNTSLRNFDRLTTAALKERTTFSETRL